MAALPTKPKSGNEHITLPTVTNREFLKMGVEEQRRAIHYVGIESMAELLDFKEQSKQILFVL